MTYTPPKKPEKLDPESMWATVAQVHRSDGHGPHEKTWAREIFQYRSTEHAAKDAAEVWWLETDQACDCEVTIAIERPDGTIVSHQFKVFMKLVAKRVVPT